MFKIIEWGPGYRQRHQTRNTDPVILVGALAVTISDPTKVLFWEGLAHLVVYAIPSTGDTRKFYVGGGEFGNPEALYDRRGDRLMEYLQSVQGTEILEHFNALPVVKDYRPSAKKINGFLYRGRTLAFYDPTEHIDPTTRTLPSPSILFKTVG